MTTVGNTPWGVLVSETVPTAENGLLSIQQKDSFVFHDSSRVVIRLVKESVRIGRMSSNDIQLSRNPCISSVHCSLSIMRIPGNESEGETIVVTFSDYSRNGCSVNQVPIGRTKSYSPVRSGDILVLMDAGKRTPEYNTSFSFYLWVDFQHQQIKHSQVIPSSNKAIDSSAIDTRRLERKRKFFLVSSWNASAQAQRMYSHSVKDFYVLDKQDPLGEGAFGKVFRAALRPLRPEAFQAAQTFPPLTSPFASLLEWSEEELGRQRSTYIKRRELIPSNDLLRASKMATEQLLSTNNSRKRIRNIMEKNESGEPEVVVYSFAVKIVQKQRVWFDDSTASLSAVLGSKRVPVSVEEKNFILDLLQLETPIEEEAHQKMEEFLEDELKQLPSSITFSQESQKVGITKENSTGSKASREALLLKLSPPVRQLYQKARRAGERRKCEVNILVSVSHPNVIRLYEVFDSGDELALVMEQATGGEVWSLLQPPKLLDKHSAVSSDQLGGPLPEFIVKIIITQVIEAVIYLHSMGVIHRDLKLENLLLKRPANIRQLVALQCEMLQHKIEEQLAQKYGIVSFLKSCQSLGEYRITNPLSPLYTVHVPRALWPVVQITDFGLSRVIETSSPGDHTLDDVYQRNDLKTNCGTPNYSAPEVLNKSLRANKAGYGAAVDMFSIGVIAFALLTNRLPYAPVKMEKDRGGSFVDYDAPLCFQRVRRLNAALEAGSSLTSSSLPYAALLPWTLQVKDKGERKTGFGAWSSDALAVALLSDTPMNPEEYICLLSDIRDSLKAFNEAPDGKLDIDRFASTGSGPTSTTSTSGSSVIFLPEVSPLARDFLSSLLTPYPNRRMCAHSALQHPWLQECLPA